VSFGRRQCCIYRINGSSSSFISLVSSVLPVKSWFGESLPDLKYLLQISSDSLLPPLVSSTPAAMCEHSRVKGIEETREFREAARTEIGRTD